MSYDTITVTPSSPHIGVEIVNIDLTRPLTNRQVQRCTTPSSRTELSSFETRKLILNRTNGLCAISANLTSTWAGKARRQRPSPAILQSANAEPALVLSLPEKPTELDDGLLTDEVPQLKLNADWVVRSACNTASAEKPGAEVLSGLARAFFYAGARSLIVSNWEVSSDSAVTLMVGTFAALAADPKLSHAEALRKSMLAMIDQHPEQADPKYWAPFVVGGEPAKPAN
jgi:hypothetical protein